MRHRALGGLVIIATVAVAAPGYGDHSQTLSLTPSSGRPGYVVKASGGRFQPGSEIQLRWDSFDSRGRVLQTLRADRQGNFSDVPFNVPAEAPAGAHTVWACYPSRPGFDSDCDPSARNHQGASSPFSVLRPNPPTDDPRPGDPPPELDSVPPDPSDDLVPGEADIGPTEGSPSITSPHSVPGTQPTGPLTSPPAPGPPATAQGEPPVPVIALGSPPGGRLQLALDRPSSEPGGVAVATGQGCPPAAQVTIRLRGEEVGRGTADESGNFRVPLHLPALEVGRYMVSSDCGLIASETLDMVLTSEAGAGAGWSVLALFLFFLFLIVGLARSRPQR